MLARAMQMEPTIMRGFITEQHFTEAESEFPGIRAVYLACSCDDRPTTFLELVSRYLGVAARAAKSSVSTPPVAPASY